MTGTLNRWWTFASICIVALAMSPAAEAGGALGETRARATLDFRIVVPPVVQMKTVRQPQALVVTAQDVAAGYVTLEEGMEVDITSNVRHGPDVQLALASPVVRSALVTGLARVLRVHDAPVRVKAQMGRGTTQKKVRLNFRLDLAPGTAPGAYPWPVTMTLVNG